MDECLARSADGAVLLRRCRRVSVGRSNLPSCYRKESVISVVNGRGNIVGLVVTLGAAPIGVLVQDDQAEGAALEHVPQLAVDPVPIPFADAARKLVQVA